MVGGGVWLKLKNEIGFSELTSDPSICELEAIHWEKAPFKMKKCFRGGGFHDCIFLKIVRL